MDIIRTLGVFLVYKKKGLIKMEMNELQTLRHSASHILAQAVKRLYPDTKLAIGPAIDDGFYYDIVSYKLYDSEGYLSDSGQIYLGTSLSVGDKFKDDSLTIYDLMPGETYTLQLLDYGW